MCRLKKSIYGLKQAGRNWNKLFDSWLKDNNFRASKVDPCLYILNTNESTKFLALAIYVDDIISVDNMPELREKLVADLSKKSKLVDLQEAKWVLGTRIQQSEGSISIDQEKYLNDVLERFGMRDAKPAKTPAVAGGATVEKSEPYKNRSEYQSLVGSLIYLAVVTRPDISFAVGKAGQAMANPTDMDWISAKRILRFAKLNKDAGPVYSNTGNQDLTGYSDSDWGGDLKTRRSTTGYIFTLEGAAISWKSKRQTTVAISSTEAEYMAGCATAQEAIYLRMLLKDLGREQKEPTLIYQDNQGAIAIGKAITSNRRAKHMNIKYHCNN